jgi:hypothetical protein
LVTEELTAKNNHPNKLASLQFLAALTTPETSKLNRGKDDVL